MRGPNLIYPSINKKTLHDASEPIQKRDASLLYRSRFKITATHPANTPPPKIVKPMERASSHVPDEDDPYSKSRTPPCTIKMAKVSNAPIPNHHANVRTVSSKGLQIALTNTHALFRSYRGVNSTQGRNLVSRTDPYGTNYDDEGAISVRPFSP